MTPEQLRQRRRERKIIWPEKEFDYDDYDVIVGDMEIRFVKKSVGSIIPFPYRPRSTLWVGIQRLFKRGNP